jgi:hypothetical protein
MADSKPSPKPAPPDPAGGEEPFGVNELRLNGRQWLLVLVLVALVALLTPRLWPRLERWDTGPDYRLPYSLSKDYWLFSRRLRDVADAKHVLVLGDSVVWGEYVLPEGTLSHFLNHETGEMDRFINTGVNGFFPLALEGLTRYYGQALRQQRIVIQCNVLWMTSPKADLSTTKEETFNHSRLVPQFLAHMPCYRADAHERISAVIERHVPFLAWVGHLQDAYFDQKSIPKWTLADDGADPAHYPNLYKNPLAPITLRVPAAPAEDPQRGPKSPRHKPWSEDGKGTVRFEWVEPEASLQWGAFQRVIGLLRERGNNVLVVLGPFNEHLLAEENRPAYRKIHDHIAAWLSQNQIPFVAPPPLPSALYADASHPLTAGYALLAKQIHTNETFHKWLSKP